MKIAFAIGSMNKRAAKGRGETHKGGAERVLVELANELSERGHQVTIFCTDINNRDEFMYPILPRVQYCNLLEEIQTDFINRTKFKFGKKFIKSFMYLKWRFFNAIKHLQNLLQFFGKNHQKVNEQSNPPSDNKKPSRSDWKLNQIFYNYMLNYPKFIKQTNPDVLIIFSAFNFFLHRLSRLFTKKDFPIIYSVQSSVSAYFDCVSKIPDPYALVRLNKVLELVDSILVLLPEFINELPKSLQNKALSIPNPINQVDKHKRANTELNTGLKTILVVGRLRTEKNHAVLLDAFAKLSPEHPDWQVKIFGEGGLRKELADQISELKLTNKVFLMGTTDAIHEEYQKAHILAMPSKFEGFGLALGEAMAHGLPAVGFDNASGVNFLIQHGHNGLLADGNNPVESLTLCLKQLMTNPALRAELGQNGVETIKLFEPKKIYDLWEKTILEVKNNFNKTSQPL